MLHIITLFETIVNIIKGQAHKFYLSVMNKRPGELYFKPINENINLQNLSSYYSRYSRPDEYWIPPKSKIVQIHYVTDVNKERNNLQYYSNIKENLGNGLSFLLPYFTKGFLAAATVFVLVYFLLSRNIKTLKETVLSFIKPSKTDIYTMDNALYSGSTLVNADDSIYNANETHSSTETENLKTVKHKKLLENLLASTNSRSEQKPILTPLDFNTNKSGISDVVLKFYDQQLDQTKFLDEEKRNEKLEQFLFEMLEIDENNKNFLLIDLAKIHKIDSNNTTYTEIIKSFESGDFESLNNVDIYSFGKDLVLTYDFKTLKLTLFAINILLNYASKENKDLLRKALVKNLSLILKKFHKVAETYGDEELFNYFLVTIVNLYTGLFVESVHITQLKKCMRTFIDIGCSSSIWNRRPKKCFFCCALITCCLRFKDIQENFDELFPFHDIYDLKIKEEKKIKYNMFYLSLCKILVLNYIGRNINSLEEIDNFVQTLTSKFETELVKSWPSVNGQLQEIQYILEYYSDLKLAKS